MYLFEYRCSVIQLPSSSQNATVSTLIAELSKLDGNLAVEIPVEGVCEVTDCLWLSVSERSVFIGE